MRDRLFASGQQLGSFRLLTLQGMGSSGEVWSALSAESRDVVALKIYRDAPDAKALATAEYEMARKIEHAHILRPTDLLCLARHQVIVMPLCEGRSVDGIAGYMSEQSIWQLLRDIASALAALHQAGLVHHDVKPSNILWGRSGFMLTDFGSCHQVDAGKKADAVAADESSFRFDAPELVRGVQTAGSDIWSLGATAFNLFMGCHVFNGLGGRAQHEGSPLPYIRKQLPELSSLVCQCLTFDFAQRPTAQAVHEVALQQMERCAKQKKERKLKVRDDAPATAAADFWPDEMQ